MDTVLVLAPSQILESLWCPYTRLALTLLHPQHDQEATRDHAQRLTPLDLR
jgi:hypothetical protein